MSTAGGNCCTSKVLKVLGDCKLLLWPHARGPNCNIMSANTAKPNFTYMMLSHRENGYNLTLASYWMLGVYSSYPN